MGLYVTGQIIRLMATKRIHVKGARALVLGMTFKENCPDIRNSKVIDVVRELRSHGASVDIFDPWANIAECLHEYGMKPLRTLKRGYYDVAIVAVAHQEFRDLGARGVRRLCRKNHVVYDIKHVFSAAEVDGRL
jgi:UDP-N-acetyl-D-galactosamine dehydrogenase